MKFLTFTNTGYTLPTRILDQAKTFGVFDEILHKTELDIPDFIHKHASFIKRETPGYGRFIWKPKIILDTLLDMKEDDILFYCDSGVHLNIQGLPRFHEYVRYLDIDGISMVTFNTNDRYKSYMYVKQDAVQFYYPEFNTMHHLNCSYAGVVFFKRTDASIAFLNDWLSLCETYHFLDSSRSIYYPEVSGFAGQDMDNGLFNLVKAKHKIHYDITPDEINLYHSSGAQMAHMGLTTHPNTWDWSSLKDCPFQTRRDR